MIIEMNNRDYSEYASESAVRELVDSLANPSLSASDYRDAMIRLGRELGGSLLDSVKRSENDIFVVCTVEDADYLARGLIETLEGAGLGSRIRLFCLWNGKVRDEGISLSPVLRQYKEPGSSTAATMVIVKSIISGACVVKTNLTRALSTIRPESIFVAAPVLYEGAQKRLADEFPRDVAEKFTYRWFATDHAKSGDVVIPGVGGSVYERLGFGNEIEKNKITPDIVRQRRKERPVALSV